MEGRRGGTHPSFSPAVAHNPVFNTLFRHTPASHRDDVVDLEVKRNNNIYYIDVITQNANNLT